MNPDRCSGQGFCNLNQARTELVFSENLKKAMQLELYHFGP